MERPPRKDPAAVSLGRKGGRVRSAAKAQAARENGKRGGRPRRIPPPPPPDPPVIAADPR